MRRLVVILACCFGIVTSLLAGPVSSTPTPTGTRTPKATPNKTMTAQVTLTQIAATATAVSAYAKQVAHLGTITVVPTTAPTQKGTPTKAPTKVPTLNATQIYQATQTAIANSKATQTAIAIVATQVANANFTATAAAATSTALYQATLTATVSAPTYKSQWGNHSLFGWITNLAIDSSDNVYTTEETTHLLRRFNPTITATVLVQCTITPVISMAGVCASGNTALVVDSYNNRVIKFKVGLCNGVSNALVYDSSFGKFGATAGKFNMPKAITTDTNGNIYVVDVTRVQKFTSDYAYLLQWGSYGSGKTQFLQPVAIAADSSNNIYVVDQGLNVVKKFDSSGNYITQFGGSIPNPTPSATPTTLKAPTSIAIDPSNNIYVADSLNHKIVKFTSAGTFLFQWGSYGRNNGQFLDKCFLAADSNYNIYVADSGNYRIQKFGY